MICAPCRGHDLGHFFDLLAAFDAARTRHGDHVRAADFDLADFYDGALRLEMAARQLIGRDDAMAFLDALHRLEIGGVHFVHRPHAAEHRVHYAGRPVHREPEASPGDR